MRKYLLYNGHFYNNTKPIITADNRGLRYGDGLFETLRKINDTILFKDWHFERLFAGLHLLQFELPDYFTPSWLADQVTALCKRNRHDNARVRINVIRGNGGLYDPENHIPNCIIQSWPLLDNGFQLNGKGLATGIYNGAAKSMDMFSHYKCNNYLPSAMAALHAQKNNWNDAFILNAAGRICDATTANVFIVKNEIIYTCPLQEGCVAGIMRRHLLASLPPYGFTVTEQPITIENLLAADEVFLSNAIQGVRWVDHCAGTTYTNTCALNIFKKLLKNYE